MLELLVVVPILLLVALAALLAFRMAKYGGSSGAIFKSRITRTAGTLNVVNAPRGLRISVHSLQRQHPGWVGVEFQHESDDSWQSSPLTLTKDEAIQLSELLADAAGSA